MRRFFACMGGAAFLVCLFSLDLFARQRPGRDLGRSEIGREEGVDDSLNQGEFRIVEDRWGQFYRGRWFDSYNQNILKGDLPVFGSAVNPWFLELGLISNSLFEWRDIPIPVGGVSTARSGSNDVFGDGEQFVFAETLSPSFSLYQGNTTFKPPNFDFRVTPVFNFNHVRGSETGILRVNPSQGTDRSDHHFGFQELFMEFHLFDLSERYDFVATRLGIQNFNSDFRGFVFTSSEPGLRVFGNYDENRWQYNLAYFRRLEKDTNSGLNTLFEDRHEDIWIANLYRQDLPLMGHTLQLSFIYRSDKAGDEGARYDKNGFLVRPAAIGDERPNNIENFYFGVNGDGHVGRFNLSESVYMASGEESHNAIAGQKTDILAFMGALEISYDFDWWRLKVSSFYASGDRDPFDDRSEGFDSVVDSPNFAGGEFSYWLREEIPFIGGGGVALKTSQSLLPSLRAGKAQGQANFVNPGIRIFHLGADLDLTPKLKWLTNFSFLQFDEVAALEALRQDGSISRNIGYDFSGGFLYRPWLNNNVQIRSGAALFLPEEGFENLFGDSLRTQVFANLVLQY